MSRACQSRSCCLLDVLEIVIDSVMDPTFHVTMSHIWWFKSGVRMEGRMHGMHQEKVGWMILNIPQLMHSEYMPHCIFTWWEMGTWLMWLSQNYHGRGHSRWLVETPLCWRRKREGRDSIRTVDAWRATSIQSWLLPYLWCHQIRRKTNSSSEKPTKRIVTIRMQQSPCFSSN